MSLRDTWSYAWLFFLQEGRLTTRMVGIDLSNDEIHWSWWQWWTSTYSKLPFFCLKLILGPHPNLFKCIKVELIYRFLERHILIILNRIKTLNGLSMLIYLYYTLFFWHLYVLLILELINFGSVVSSCRAT